jgi:UDP-2,3-diacylglucosamine pyrophosphatase LpxH
MLAIISDLHLCDRTAVEKNVNPAAFKIALDDIYAQATWVADRLDGGRLDLVLLGDTFDLLRTERWFEVPVTERPWGTPAALGGAAPPAAVLTQANRIFDDVLTENVAALALLSGKDRPKTAGLEVRRILLPGNHDRLALHDPTLQARMRAAVDAEDERALSAEGIYPHRLELPDYGLLARHGHEWDPWNFESFHPDAGAQYGDDQYLPAPIGDAITTELVARLPYEVKQRLAALGTLSPEEKTGLYARLQHIEDVRPVFASLQWIHQEVARIGAALGEPKASALRSVVEDAVRTVVRDFLQLDFYRAWHEKHRSLLHPLGDAMQLRAALDALSVVSIDTVGHVGFLLDKLTGSDDPNRAGAMKEDLDRVGNEGLRFVAYGHTHDGLQAALRAGLKTEDVYLNSGTFRKRVFRTDDKAGFVSSEYLTYLWFFSEREATTWRKDPTLRGPAHAMWTGLQSR